MAAFDEEAMRARFRELHPKREAIRKVSAKLRAQRDKIKQDAEAKMAPLEAEIAKIEEPIKEISSEMARLARALNGKT